MITTFKQGPERFNAVCMHIPVNVNPLRMAYDCTLVTANAIVTPVLICINLGPRCYVRMDFIMQNDCTGFRYNLCADFTLTASHAENNRLSLAARPYFALVHL